MEPVQYKNLVILIIEGERCPLFLPLVPNTIAYLSNKLQSIRHSLWRNISLCVLYHSHRYLGLFLGISSIRYSPDRNKVLPCHFLSLTNINYPASVRTIWIPRIIQKTVFQVLLDQWSETHHIDLKQVITRLRLIVNNVQIFNILRRISTRLC